MSMGRLNYEALQQFGAQPVACEGGLDFLTSKVAINPGSLQECVNYEVSRESGYKIMDGMLRYSGQSEYILNRTVFARFSETTANISDLYIGGEYSVASSAAPEDGFIGTIKIFEIDVPGEIVRYQVIDGDEAALSGQNIGFAVRVYPNSNNVANYLDLDDPEVDTYTDISDYITKNIALNQNIAEGSAGLPGEGPVNILFELDEKIYAGRDITEQPSAYVYACSITSNISAFSAETDDLTNIDSVSESNVESLAANSDFTFLYAVQLGAITSAAIAGDGTLPASVSSTTGGPDNTSGIHLSATGEYFGVLHSTASSSPYNGTNFSICTASGTTFTREDSINVGSGATLVDVEFSTDDTQILVTSGSAVYLLSWDAGTSTLAVEDSITSLTNPEATFVGNRRAAISDGADLDIYNTTSDTFSSSLDTKTYSAAITDLFYGANNYLFVGDVNTPKLFSVQIDLDGTITEVDSLDVEAGSLRGTKSGNFIFGGNSSDGDLRGFRVDGDGKFTLYREIAVAGLFPTDDLIVNEIVSGEVLGTRLYTPTEAENLSKDVEWETVDLGYEVGFDAGQQRPITYYDRQFVGEDFETPENPTDITGSFAASVLNADAQSVFQPYQNWQQPENALDDQDGGSVAVAQRGPSSTSGAIFNVGTYYKTNILRITGFPFDSDTNRATGVIGVEVDVRWEYKSENTTAINTSARISDAYLRNVGGTDNKAATPLGTTTTENSAQTTTIGGAADDWNAAEPNIQNFLNSNFGVDLVFETAFTSGTTTNEAEMTVKVDWVRITLTLDNATQKVYFWNTSTDVATGDVVNVFVSDGEFGDGDAEGVLSIYDVTNPSSIIEDLEIRTQPNGEGIKIADTTGTAEVPLLPSYDEMDARDALAQTIKSNFYIDEDREAIYGVTGAGPAFTYDGTYFRKIRAPIPVDQDKPRHIAEHQSHLVLAYQSGSILLSVVGDPLNFSGVEGASEFGFGDEITGLIGLTGTALGVLCEQSTHALVGNTINNFSTQIISKSTGSIEYSAVNMGQPIYCDFRGVSNIQATEKYGDFAWGRLSQYISDWLQERLQDSNGIKPGLLKIKAAMPVRNKNQYRLFFNDGFILTMTLQGEQPQFTIQNMAYNDDTPDQVDRTYVPTALMSTVLPNGREINAIGTTDGQVYIMDQGCGIYTADGLTSYDAFIVFNPFNGGASHLNMRYKEIIIHGLTSGWQELFTSAGVNYLKPETSAYEETVTIGDSTDNVTFEQGARRRIPGRVSTHLPEITDGFSLKIRSEADGNIPHTIQALTFRIKPLSDKNAAPARY